MEQEQLQQADNGNAFNRAGEANPVARGGDTFNRLAKFLFGGNDAGSKMKMTTPVFTDTTGANLMLLAFTWEPCDCRALLGSIRSSPSER